MLPLGLGRNSAGLLRALRTPIPRSPGLPEAAGSGVLSGWRNLRRKPCRIRLCRHFSRRAWAHSSAHFFAALRGSNPESFVARQSRRVAAFASAADAGRTARAEAWPARRPPSEHCRRQRLRVLLLPCLPCADSCAPAGVRVRAREAAFPAMFRRLGASPFCRGALTGFSCVSGRMAETHAAGKALTPARSRKRAECGRPGLPHSG